MSSTPSTRRRLDGVAVGGLEQLDSVSTAAFCRAPDSLVVYAQVPATKRPPNPQGGAMLEAAARVLADPDAPRTREEAVEQVMAATQALAAGRGIQEAVAASGRRALERQKRKRSAHPLKRKMRKLAGRSDDAAGGAAGAAAAPGRAAALRERVKAKRRARRASSL
jgi:hypothetical protein